MHNRNICKFPPNAFQDRLSIHCFVRETDGNIISEKRQLKHHRAVLVEKGSGHFLMNDVLLPFAVGTLLFAFKEEAFSAVTAEECEYLYIDFEGSRADELFRRFDIGRHQRVFSGFDGLIPLWHESLSRASEKNVDLAAESILLLTFSRLLNTASAHSDLIRRALEISEERLTDQSLSLSCLADELGYNAKYLSHLFKEKMRVGYAEYLRSLRIRYAISLFDRGIDSVKNVALLSGFADPLYFSTVFKKSVGTSPKEYVKKSCRPK